MARTKVTPKKERERKTVLRTKAERAQIAEKTWSEKRKAKRAREEEKRKELKGPPSPVHHSSPVKKPSPVREVEQTLEEAERWVKEAR